MNTVNNIQVHCPSCFEPLDYSLEWLGFYCSKAYVNGCRLFLVPDGNSEENKRMVEQFNEKFNVTILK